MTLAIFDKSEEIKPFQMFLQKEIERTWSSLERIKCRSLEETMNLTEITLEQNGHDLEEELEP